MFAGQRVGVRGCKIKYATPCGPFRRPLISISNEPLYRCFSHDFTSVFTPRRPLMAVIFIIKGRLALLIPSPFRKTFSPAFTSSWMGRYILLNPRLKRIKKKKKIIDFNRKSGFQIHYIVSCYRMRRVRKFGIILSSILRESYQ